MSPRPDLTMTRPEVDALLGLPLTGVLSTIGADGMPHAAGMYYVPGPAALSMWAYAKSQKVVNLRRDPKASFLVEDGAPYRDLRGVLVRGLVTVVDDAEEVFAIGCEVYRRYFEEKTGVSLESAEPELRRQASKRAGLRLPMERLTSWDHSRA